MTTDNALEGLVNDLTSHAPAVREDVIANLEGRNDAASTVGSVGVSSGVSSKSGLDGGGHAVATETFDPSIHETMPDGSPRLTLGGQFRRKRGRRSNTVPAGINGAPTQASVDYKGTAQFLCAVVFGGLESLFGPAWKPQPQESQNIEAQAARVCEKYGVADLPPVMGLCLAFGVYAVPRLADSETQYRARVLGSKLGVCRPPKPKVSEEPPCTPS